MNTTVTRAQVRSMIQEMLSELVVSFDDERADEACLTQPTVELSDDERLDDDVENACVRALDRLDRAAERRDP